MNLPKGRTSATMQTQPVSPVSRQIGQCFDLQLQGCTYAYMFVHIHTHTDIVCASLCVSIYIYIYIYLCVCVHAYTHTYMNSFIIF